MRSLVPITIAFALLLTGFSSALAADFNGFMSIDTVQANPGQHFGVKVRLHDNDMAFSTLFIPLHYGNPNLTLDSVSYNGSIKPYDFTGFDFDYSDRGLLQISYVPPLGTYVPAIHTPGGIVAELFFTLDPQAPAGFIPLDSANIDSVVYVGQDEVHLWIKALMADSTGTVSHYPEVRSGGIVVSSPTDVNDGHDNTGLPTDFALSQNYPNPFNPTTHIGYALPKAGHVKLEVFNILGQEVSTLVDRYQVAGSYEAEFDASAFPSGIYFYRLTQGEYSDTKKMALVK